jgi:hypothetical protein
MSDLKTGGQTPRADGMIKRTLGLPGVEIEYIEPEDARTLERELTEAKERCQEYAVEAGTYTLPPAIEAELMTLRRSVAAHAADRAMLETRIAEAMKSAFFEGYSEGWGTGVNDGHPLSIGTHNSTKDKESAWQDSDSFASIQP